MCKYTWRCTHAHRCLYVHMHIHTRECAHTLVKYRCTHRHKHTCMQYIHVYISTWIFTHMRRDGHTCLYMNACKHKCMYRVTCEYRYYGHVDISESTILPAAFIQSPSLCTPQLCCACSLEEESEAPEV